MLDLGFQACSGGFFGAGAFVKTCQVGSQHGIFFTDGVDLGLQSVEFAAGDFYCFLLVEAGLFFFGYQELIAFALCAGLFILAR